jgi:DNA-binding NarL/FixJ family response regulator
MTKVLIVEDHIMVRQMLGHLVREELGLNLVGECTAVSEAAAALLREKPDLAIVDWMLSDGRGFELVRSVGIRLPRTRWLFISSNEQGHLVREAVSLGVHGFVMKRSDLGTLRTAIKSVLAGETYYCPQSARLLVDRMVDEGRATGVALTPREREVLRRFARGENTKTIAGELGVSPKTVSNLITEIKDKLGQWEPAQLVHYAIKHGYIEAP